MGFTILADALQDEARSRTGFWDFGDPAGYRPGLDRLLAAIDEDGVVFDTEGEARVREMIVATLVARLYAEEGWRRRPECLDRPLRRPLVVTGMPRTGTTALHRLLMVDPAFQGLPRWLGYYPMPRPPTGRWPDFPEYRALAAGLGAKLDRAPELLTMHPMAAEAVDECIHLLKQDFRNNFWGSSLPVPSYDRWWWRADEAPSYVRACRLLQLIGADDHRRWLLKNPGHIWSLDALIATMPDAVVVQTHRAPIAVLSSLASLLAALHRQNAGSAADGHAIARRELAVWSEATARAMAVRDRLAAQGAACRFVDVRQAEMHADPIGTVRIIYAALDVELAPDVEAAMRARVANDPERRHGAHRHAPADVGLDGEEVDARFADYKRRFGV